MFNRQNSKRAVENFLVAKRGVALYNTANNHINTNTGSILLADGQLGFFDASGMGSNKLFRSLASGATAVQSPWISICQGTEDSAQPWNSTKKYPLVSRPFETSGVIKSQGIVSVTKCDYAPATYSSWVIGTTALPIVATKNTEYTMAVSISGHRSEEFYSEQQANFVNVSYTSPDYTTLATAEKEDDLIQNLVYNLNSNTAAFNQNNRRGNNNPLVAFAIDSTGTTGTEIATLAANTFLPVVSTTTGVKGFYPNAEMVASIKAAATAAGLTTASILTVNLATAGTTTGGVADSMMICALDSTLAYKDYGTLVKNRLDISLGNGFDFTKVYHKQEVKAFEGQGKGLVLDRQYRSTQGQRKYGLIHVEDPIIEYASPIATDDTYTTYVIEHLDVQSIDAHNNVEFRLKDVVLIPTLVKGTVNGSTNSQETAFESFMNTYLASAGKQAIVNHAA